MAALTANVRQFNLLKAVFVVVGGIFFFYFCNKCSCYKRLSTLMTTKCKNLYLGQAIEGNDEEVYLSFCGFEQNKLEIGAFTASKPTECF